MKKAHQIKLYPNKSQEIFFIKSCGVARFAYNWALNKWKEDYKQGVKQSAYSLVKYLNSIKKIEFPWMQETGKTCSQYAIHHVEAAYKNMWEGNLGYPRFKKKGVKDSFVSVENSLSFKQKDNKLWIPRLGWVKCAENLRFDGKVNNVVIKRVADMWFASINMVIEDMPITKPVVDENQVTIGIDMGISSMMVCSDGTVYENPRALKSNLKGLKKLQRVLSRKVVGSENYKKQKTLLSRKHYKISCLRKNAIHKATSDIVKKYDRIVIEDLNVKGMMKNHNLSQSLSDVSFGEARRQFTYKCKWAGKELVIADRWYPSSKLCSGCGNKKENLTLSERMYRCNNCGLEISRDLNAAINLAKYSPTSKCGGSEACGERSSVVELQHSLSLKQEITILMNQIMQQC